jgi:hypothetical protein
MSEKKEGNFPQSWVGKLIPVISSEWEEKSWKKKYRKENNFSFHLALLAIFSLCFFFLFTISTKLHDIMLCSIHSFSSSHFSYSTSCLFFDSTAVSIAILSHHLFLWPSNHPKWEHLIPSFLPVPVRHSFVYDNKSTWLCCLPFTILFSRLLHFSYLRQQLSVFLVWWCYLTLLR